MTATLDSLHDIEADLASFLVREIIEEGRAIDGNSDVKALLEGASIGYNGAALLFEAHVSKKYRLTQSQIREKQGQKITITEAAGYIMEKRAENET